MITTHNEDGNPFGVANALWLSRGWKTRALPEEGFSLQTLHPVRAIWDAFVRSRRYFFQQ